MQLCASFSLLNIYKDSEGVYTSNGSRFSRASIIRCMHKDTSSTVRRDLAFKVWKHYEGLICHLMIKCISQLGLWVKGFARDQAHSLRTELGVAVGGLKHSQVEA
ncbi:uncharacterized protein LOC132611339 [Lycium barbarum]|uniref:uncharacterized protein LOC132611339 n=1 Tax=Lycium barbarum TaxID=112863 RepID=UPI00293F2A99|nr:uncharacterized protein LOC132611339 [Lycium barbarum]